MKWEEPVDKKGNIYELPGNWLKIEYFEALTILFRVENALRVFVYIILKKHYKDKWKDLSLVSDDEENSTISAIAKRRLSQDKNYAYLGYILGSPLLHLTSGELIRLITSDSYWKYFKHYFLGTKEIIKTKLDEIGNVRNSVAHFRPIKKGDIDLIKQNSIHTLIEIEKTLFDFISCQYIVPTNSSSDWYKEIITIGSNECNIILKQSKTEEWIQLSLTFSSPITTHDFEDISFNSFTAFNLKTNGVFKKYPNIVKNVISITEQAKTFCSEGISDAKIIKALRFTFSKQTIEENYQLIKKDIEELVLQISTELSLIKDDNLARGEVIESVKCYLEPSKYNHYFISNKKFISEFDENSPVEFWGDLIYAPNNFITETDNYPWMPVAISEDKGLPF